MFCLIMRRLFRGGVPGSVTKLLQDSTVSSMFLCEAVGVSRNAYGCHHVIPRSCHEHHETSYAVSDTLCTFQFLLLTILVNGLAAFIRF